MHGFAIGVQLANYVYDIQLLHARLNTQLTPTQVVISYSATLATGSCSVFVTVFQLHVEHVQFSHFVQLSPSIVKILASLYVSNVPTAQLSIVCLIISLDGAQLGTATYGEDQGIDSVLNKRHVSKVRNFDQALNLTLNYKCVVNTSGSVNEYSLYICFLLSVLKLCLFIRKSNTHIAS